MFVQNDFPDDHLKFSDFPAGFKFPVQLPPCLRAGSQFDKSFISLKKSFQLITLRSNYEEKHLKYVLR